MSTSNICASCGHEARQHFMNAEHGTTCNWQNAGGSHPCECSGYQHKAVPEASLMSLRGSDPHATGNQLSEDFVRDLRAAPAPPESTG